MAHWRPDILGIGNMTSKVSKKTRFFIEQQEVQFVWVRLNKGEAGEEVRE